MKYIAAIMSLVLLAGCKKSLDATDCHTSNWYQVGVADGQVGKVRDLQKTMKACSQYGAVVDISAYQLGYRKGLIAFCQPTEATGHAYGTQGIDIKYIHTRGRMCANHNIPMKIAAYERGRQQGIKMFCRYDNAYNAGRRGNHTNKSQVCPLNLRDQYIAGWRAGNREYWREEMRRSFYHTPTVIVIKK